LRMKKLALCVSILALASMAVFAQN